MRQQASRYGIWMTDGDDIQNVVIKNHLKTYMLLFVVTLRHMKRYSHIIYLITLCKNCYSDSHRIKNVTQLH
jgi:hypothetical protein